MICTVSIECTVYSVVHRKQSHVLCVTASLLFAPPSPPPPGQRVEVWDVFMAGWD